MASRLGECAAVPELNAEPREPVLAVSAREAARLLSLPLSTLYTLAKQGKIPSVRIGGRVLFPRGALRRIVDAPEERKGD